MTKKKSTKKYVELTRNSYKGRLKGVLPAFLPNRCSEIANSEAHEIKIIHDAIVRLLARMDKV